MQAGPVAAVSKHMAKNKSIHSAHFLRRKVHLALAGAAAAQDLPAAGDHAVELAAGARAAAGHGPIPFVPHVDNNKNETALWASGVRPLCLEALVLPLRPTSPAADVETPCGKSPPPLPGTFGQGGAQGLGAPAAAWRSQGEPSNESVHAGKLHARWEHE